MNKLFKAICASFAGAAAAAAMTFSAFAVQDYEFDASHGNPTTGSWGQAYTIYTLPSGADADQLVDFDASWMTPDSEVIAEYTYEGELNAEYPIELIWQTWGDSREQDPNIKDDWNRIAPDEHTDTYAKFTYDSIVEAYGTDDFSKVFAINLGDCGVALTVKKLKITNCNPGGVVEEVTEPAETESAEGAAVTNSIVENAPDDTGAGSTVIIIVIIAAAVIAAVVFLILFMKKRGNSNY